MDLATQYQAFARYNSWMKHHRGQVTALLKQFGLDPGVTDFMLLFRYPVHAH